MAPGSRNSRLRCARRPPTNCGGSSSSSVAGVTPRADDHERDLARYRAGPTRLQRTSVSGRCIAPGCAKAARVVDATSVAGARRRHQARQRDASSATCSPAHISISLPWLARHEPSSWGDTRGAKRLGGYCLPSWSASAVDGPRSSQAPDAVVRATEGTQPQWFGDRSRHGASSKWGGVLCRPHRRRTGRQMRESGRERPPSPTRETGFRAIPEGRSRPDSEPRFVPHDLAQRSSGCMARRAAHLRLARRVDSVPSRSAASPATPCFGRNGPWR